MANFPHVFMHKHVFQGFAKKRGTVLVDQPYVEPYLPEQFIPIGLPPSWHKLARKNMLVTRATQYDDPTVEKKHRKANVDGKFIHVVDIISKKSGIKVDQVPIGDEPPTQL